MMAVPDGFVLYVAPEKRPDTRASTDRVSYWTREPEHAQLYTSNRIRILRA